jgi:hypothetical protein
MIKRMATQDYPEALSMFHVLGRLARARRGLLPGVLICGIPCALVFLSQSVREVEGQDHSPAQDQFTGNWELVTYEIRNRDGALEARGMTGRIMYDAHGNMAAQLMPANTPEGPTVEGYIAYFATYTIDESKTSVTHHVRGSNIARWVGTDLVRYYAFEDGMLTLTLRQNDTVTGRLVWKRLE